MGHNTFSALVVTIALGGCATSTQLLPADRPPIPASLLQPCPPLTPLAGKDGAALTRKLVEVGQAYNECAAGKAALIKAAGQGGV